MADEDGLGKVRPETGGALGLPAEIASRCRFAERSDRRRPDRNVQIRQSTRYRETICAPPTNRARDRLDVATTRTPGARAQHRGQVPDAPRRVRAARVHPRGAQDGRAQRPLARELEALPAQFEGVHASTCSFATARRDSAWYSVIDDEWPEVRGRTFYAARAARLGTFGDESIASGRSRKTPCPVSAKCS